MQLCLSFLFSVYKCPDDCKFPLAIVKVSMPQYKSISDGFHLLPSAGFHPRPSSLMQQQVLLTEPRLLLSAAVRCTSLTLTFGFSGVIVDRVDPQPPPCVVSSEHRVVGLYRYPCRVSTRGPPETSVRVAFGIHVLSMSRPIVPCILCPDVSVICAPLPASPNASVSSSFPVSIPHFFYYL